MALAPGKILGAITFNHLHELVHFFLFILSRVILFFTFDLLSSLATRTSMNPIEFQGMQKEARFVAFREHVSTHLPRLLAAMREVEI
jgi:hypothetical protein